MLQVLYDSGDTLPLAPLLSASGFDEDEEEAPASDVDESAAKPLMSQALRRRSVIQSPGLTPGVQPRIATGQAGAMLPRPLFLVGADDASLAWLAKHRDRLMRIGAVGLIVQADGEADIEKVRAAAGKLQLAAGSGAMLARHFGLTHYPVLIGPEWIEQ
ncbi:MAG TPA: integrating conjugative element protein [Chromatiaceae bacterium]|nr:integrating conjugative element protein [Chromatiaceae bacterium]